MSHIHEQRFVTEPARLGCDRKDAGRQANVKGNDPRRYLAAGDDRSNLGLSKKAREYVATRNECSSPHANRADSGKKGADVIGYHLPDIEVCGNKFAQILEARAVHNRQGARSPIAANRVNKGEAII